MPLPNPVYTTLPDIPVGYPLNGEWEVIMPIARTNEITNPSFELATTGYTAGAGTLARTATKQYHGSYSAMYTPSAALVDGFYYAALSTTINEFRAISCKFLGQPNISYVVSINTNVGVELTAKVFKATGRWQWVTFYWFETATSTRRIYFRKQSSTDVHPFYVDGVQSEVINTGELVSTYIDGDQAGFLANQAPYPYGWNGTPHASSSYRLLSTRAGGYVIPFKKFGFLLTAIIGLGLAQAQTVVTEYAQLDGGFPGYTRKPVDQFSIVGNLSEGTYRALRTTRGSLSRLFDRDVSAYDQNMLLRYHHTDNCGTRDSDHIVVPCRYTSGWEGQVTNHSAQVVTMTFQTYLPNISLEMEAGAALTVQTTLAHIGMTARSAAGVWSIPVTALGTSPIFNSVFYSRTGRIYISGSGFTSVNGTAAIRIAYQDPGSSTWVAMGTGLAGGQALSFAEGADGSIYVVGLFSSAGGVANTARVAKWNPTTSVWSSITPLGSANNTVFDAAVGVDGTLVVAGAFTTINTVAINYVAKYTIATGVWSASYSTGPGSSAQGIAFALGTVNPIVVQGPSATVKYWNGSAWTTIGTATGPVGPTISTLDVIVGSNGYVYVSGLFNAINGVTAYNVARYNGVSWAPLGTGLIATTELPPVGFAGDSQVAQLAQLPNGNIIAVGSFQVTNGASTVFGLATWDGAAWTSRDITYPSSGAGTGVTVHPDGRIAVLHDGTPATVAGQTVVNNIGTARSYPTITLRGPTTTATRVYQLANITTGRTIFLNLPITPGEVDTFSFQPDNLSFISSVYGNLQGAILPGSNEAEFFLSPGNNTIVVYSVDSTVVATIRYTPEYLSLDDLP